MGKNIKVTMFSSKNRACGIGDYTSFLFDALGHGIECSWIDLPVNPSAREWRKAAAGADSAELVHVHFEPSLFYIPRPYFNRFATLMRRIRSPIVVTLHNEIHEIKLRWPEKKPYGFIDLLRDLAYLPHFLRWEKTQYNRAQHFIVHSPVLANRLRGMVGEERVTDVCHPIPPVGCKWSPSDEHTIDLVSPGFIKSHKGYQHLLDFLLHSPSLRWCLAGGPQDSYDHAFMETFNHRIRQLDLGNRIIITGHMPRKSLEELAVRSKAAIFPFNWAAGSGSLTWAIGLGLPILATDLPPFAQYREAGAGVKLLPLNDRSFWPEIINEVLGDPSEQALLSEANLMFAQKHGYDTFARLVKEIYIEVFEREARA